MVPCRGHRGRTAPLRTISKDDFLTRHGECDLEMFMLTLRQQLDNVEQYQARRLEMTREPEVLGHDIVDALEEHFDRAGVSFVRYDLDTRVLPPKAPEPKQRADTAQGREAQ